MDERTQKKALKRFVAGIVVELALVAFVSWFFDVFYQYHSPFFGMDAVFNDRDNQMPGSIRNFSYDSVLMGSSVAENFDTAYLDTEYDCETLKLIRASGTLPELLYYLEMAESSHELKNVFWCLDLFAFDEADDIGIDTIVQKSDRYLHTSFVLDDIPYLFNKVILMERIPQWVVSSVMGVNTGGNAYNWSKGKEFGKAQTLGRYGRNPVSEEEISWRDPKEYEELVEKNLEKMKKLTETHPETNFYLILPPYSMLWWDSAYINGLFEERMYTVRRIFEEMLPMENVTLYDFQNIDAIVLNLDNYMDIMHYSPEINRFMLECMREGRYEVTPENAGQVQDDMRRLMHFIENVEIKKYYDSELSVSKT